MPQVRGQARPALFHETEQRAGAEPELWRGACRRGVSDNTGQRRSAAGGIPRGGGQGARPGACRRLRRPGCGPLIVHTDAEGHLILHDIVLHHRRHTRRKEKTGQVLPALVQHGRAPRRLPAAWRLLEDALRRGHRLLDKDIQGRAALPPLPGRVGVAQAAHRPAEILPAGVQQRHSARQPIQEIPRVAQGGASAASGVHRGSHRARAALGGGQGDDILRRGELARVVLGGTAAVDADNGILRDNTR